MSCKKTQNCKNVRHGQNCLEEETELLCESIGCKFLASE